MRYLISLPRIYAFYNEESAFETSIFLIKLKKINQNNHKIHKKKLI